MSSPVVVRLERSGVSDPLTVVYSETAFCGALRRSLVESHAVEALLGIAEVPFRAGRGRSGNADTTEVAPHGPPTLLNIDPLYLRVVDEPFASTRSTCHSQCAWVW